MTNLSDVEEILAYKFNNKEILETALTHSSYANDYLGNAHLGNERLEFLGDGILDMVVGAELYKRFPEKQEGFLSKLRSEIVCEEALANVAGEKGLNKYLKLGRGEEQKGGRSRHSIIADMMEALIAAVYVDGGILESTKVVYTLMGETIEKGCRGLLPKDSKTEFQEYCQKHGNHIPVYSIIKEDGPAHDRTFTAAVYIENKKVGEGIGKTKKEAEADAAKNALADISK